jgi:hypothetical protein
MPHSDQSEDQNLTLINFIEAVRNQGASDEFIYRLLKSYGWSEQEIESAFAQVYERSTGLPVPVPTRRSSESARDAFLYLLSFATLGIWSQALGQIGFIYVDRLFPDPLRERYFSGYGYELASSLARLIVVFPIYLLLMRLLIEDLTLNPDKYQSGVRKWLTYIVLVIAALIAIVDVFVFLTSFLQGELTLRFTFKVLIVLVIAGGILWYYLSWLQRQPVKS